MTKRNIPSILLILTTIFLFASSCKNNYDESLDDLVHGIYFGMEKDAFFKHCWDLNQEGKTGHGTVDNNVMYEDSVNFEPKVVINFYPEFVDEKISEFPLSFYFKGWSPWKKNELSQELLYGQVLQYFEKKYEVKFDEKKLSNGKVAHYKVLTPVTIRIYKDVDEMLVKADIKHSGFQEKQ